jgi:hypothetical protein
LQSLRLSSLEHLDRSTIVPWIRSVFDSLSGADPEAFHTQMIAPAGTPIALQLDDPRLAAPYGGRFVGWGNDAPPFSTHFVLTGQHPGLTVLPEWTDPAFGQADLDTLLAGEGLRASYQDRNWRLFDTVTRTGVQISLRQGALRPWHAGLLLVEWTLQSAGLSLTHAGTVGLDGRGLLLVGQSGSGKSGTTLAGLAEGLQTVGDDFVALGFGEQPVARSVFPLARQDPAGLDRIAGLRQRVARHRVNHLGKFEFDLRPTFPGAFVDELTLDAIVLPVISDAATPSITPIPPADAMVELLRSNPFRYVGSPGSRMARFAALTRSRPCFRLTLSTDAGANGRALRHLLEGLAPH